MMAYHADEYCTIYHAACRDMVDALQAEPQQEVVYGEIDGDTIAEAMEKLSTWYRGGGK